MTSQKPALTKMPTGIRGLDDVLAGGIPRARPTLICGGPGCGKSLLALEILARSIAQTGEAGVFVSFEETVADIRTNAVSIGLDLAGMEAAGTLIIDHVPALSQDHVEAGRYDLEGLVLRLRGAVEEVGATCIAIDTIEVLFNSLHDSALVRSELSRLIDWIKGQGLTALITSEIGDAGRLSRHGISEYVTDCVLLLDHRIERQRSTRRLRIVKYRGTAHAADEYPFLITDQGIAVFPITSADLEQTASTERVTTGITDLDALLSGGVYRGVTVLVSGSAGTGKSTFAAHFTRGSCERGERVLYVSYEESPSQIQRNMTSVGLDLAAFVDRGLLRLQALRPTRQGLEAHLDQLHGLIDEHEPDLVVIDPISSMHRMGTDGQVSDMMMRLVDTLKSHNVTGVLTALTSPGDQERTNLDVSSLVDTWIRTDTLEANGERTRIMRIVKSRGSAHSNQVTEFLIEDDGIRILDPYVGPGGVLTGSARAVQESNERRQRHRASAELERHQAVLDRRRAAVEAKVAALWAELEAETAELLDERASQDDTTADDDAQRERMERHRWGKAPGSGAD